MFRGGYDWGVTRILSETKFQKLAKGLRSLEHDRVREIGTLAPAVLGTAACAYIRGYAGGTPLPPLRRAERAARKIAFPDERKSQTTESIR